MTTTTSSLIESPLDPSLAPYVIVFNSTGRLALDTLVALQDGLGDYADPLLIEQAAVHLGVFNHEFRTATMAMAVGQETGIGEALTAELVVGAALHDVGKTHPAVLPLVDYPGYFNDQQRMRMGWHTALGGIDLRVRAHDLRDSNCYAEHLLTAAALVAESHHLYGMPLPRRVSIKEMWQTVMAITTQVTDNADALTTPSKERAYRPARQRSGDGGRGGLAVLDDRLGSGFFGVRRTEKLPILGISVQDIAAIALQTKRDTFQT